MIAGSADRSEHAAACFAHQTGGGSVCCGCEPGARRGEGRRRWRVGGVASGAAAETAVVTAVTAVVDNDGVDGREAGDPGRWRMEDVGVVVGAGVWRTRNTCDCEHVETDRGGGQQDRAWHGSDVNVIAKTKANGERSWPVEVRVGSESRGVDDEAVLVRAHPALAAGSSTCSRRRQGIGGAGRRALGSGQRAAGSRIGNRELSGDAVAARGTHNNTAATATTSN